MQFTEELMRVYSTLDRSEQVRMLCELTSFVTKSSKSTLNINMLDNYNHRTLQVYDCLSRHPSVQNLAMNPKRTGKDAWCDRYRNIEIKTSKGAYPRYLFDKQNDEIRRKQIFEYDAFAFAHFQDELLTRCVFVHEPDAVQSIYRMFEAKQALFLEKNLRNIDNGKRGYDTIDITPNELKDVSHDLYQGLWNIT